MMIEVKMCESCNHRNPVSAMECESCGYDLTFVFPKMVDPNVEKEKDTSGTETHSIENGVNAEWLMISTCNDDEVFGLTGEVSVGRDCEPLNALFNSSNYTSRTHAKLRVMDDEVQVMDASTNGTFLNEKRIKKMEWVAVPDGSTIRFADVSVRIKRKQNAD